MAKKLVFIWFLFLMVFCNVFAQEDTQEETEKNISPKMNFVGGGFSMGGINTQYERMITNDISLVGEAFLYYWLFSVGITYGFDVRGRYYLPIESVQGLFVDIGTGYAGITNFWDYWQAGFHLSPGAGYKMYIGKKGPICFVPGFTLDLIFGNGGSRSYKYENKNSFASFRINASFLYSF